MQVIILAAGQGSRMGGLTTNNHKSLLPINETDSFLTHLLHQLNEYELSKVIIVTGYLSELVEKAASKYQLNIEIVRNDRYKEDTNIYSMKLALDHVNENEAIVVIEADTYMDEIAMQQIINESESDKSIWFTRGKFNPDLLGGILKSNEAKEISDIQIIRQYEDKYEGYDKLLGILTIGSKEIPVFKKLIDEYIKETLKQYYLRPWIENLSALPCYSADLSDYIVESVNTAEEHQLFVEKLKAKEQIGSVNIDLVQVKELLPIEGYIEERADLLYDEMATSDWWIKPIIVEKNNHLILDGHHRFEVSKKLGLKNIPAVLVNYDDVELWSLRKTEFVDRSTVIARAKEGDIYPNKTVKHKFPFSVPFCKIKILDLK